MNSQQWIMLALALATSGAAIVRAEDAATAENIVHAENDANAAFDAYARGDYQGAVDLYRKALSAAHSANTIYNLARIYDVKLNDRARAIEFYERYARDTGADPELLRTANERLARLRELQALAVDTKVKAAPPAATAPEPAGTRPPPPRAASRPPAFEQDGISGLQVSGIVTGAVGLAGLGVGAGYGLAASADADVAAADCDGNSCRSQRAFDAAHEASDKAKISTIAFIAGGALVAVGASLLLFGGDGDAERGSPRSMVASPYVGPDGVGTSVVGRW